MTKQRYIKPEAVKNLEEFVFQKIKEKYPNFPYPVKPLYRDDTANTLTKCIVDFINYTGGMAERINITVQKVVKNGVEKWVNPSSKIGKSDVFATRKGRSVRIEIKIGNDRQSEAQKRYQAETERSGGLYFIAKDFKSFVEWYKMNFVNGKKS